MGSAAPQTLVSGAAYKPFGPLSELTLGNGFAEIRAFDGRYFPERIEMTGRLLQTYSTDPVGNILGMERTVGAQTFSMTFAYQDPQYFLTQGNGPWGQQSWTYDRIGNRLSELAPPESLTYSYLSNPAGGHNPKLSRIEPAPGGEPRSRLDFGFDAAGNQTTAAAISGEGSGRTSFLDYSPESRLAQLRTSNGPSSTELLYDGRGLLRRSRLTATNTSDFEQTEPVYSSEGLLLARRYHKQSTGSGGGDAGAPPSTRTAMETAYILYFAGRPVAQLTRPQLGEGADTLLYLTPDHLGTPIQATDAAGAIVWEGGLDPFGTPFVFPRGEAPQEGGDRDASVVGLSASATATMESAGIFLRFPGQWDDPSFRSHGLSSGLYYNVHRWYQTKTGVYTRLDPISGRAGQASDYYRYALNNPGRYVDPFGLFTVDPSCKGCVHPHLARDNRQLSHILIAETQAFCRERLNRIQDVNLRKCIGQSCREGRIVCSKGGDECDDPLVQGYTDALGGPIGHWLRRSGIMDVVRTAVICATNPLNFSGEAGETAIHEWAHGCGYDADGVHIPGIPGADPPK